MGMKNRIEKLEQHTGAGKPQTILYVLYDGQPEPTEAQREAAIAAYKAKHPDWETKDIIVVGLDIAEATDDQLAQVITSDPDTKASDLSTADLEAIADGN